ncbi:hypothetical protein [uncultured Psychroserpens sp.]|uniref:hypothetical protein n=1 Tax=uncultured Psychroserpens sp. TaxID=255436 RepID=UPI002611C757|nr:hypothetical protein [uncultured Psychroserpens sp.]
MVKKTIVLVCIMFIWHSTKAQDHNIKEPGLELVLSGLSIYNTETDLSDFATEIHLTHWTTHKWAFGVGYTFVFEDNQRVGHEIAALVSHKPWPFLTVNTGPSISLPNSHKDTELSGYLESEFAFTLGKIHLGPTAGVLVGQDFRVFGGWHFSYEF